MTAETSLAYQQLHSLLKQLEDAEQMLAHGPRRIAAAEQKIVAAEQACAVQKEQIQLLKKSADEKSLNLNSKEAELQKLEGRLNQATSNKEYDIIQAQKASEKAAGAELEDQILSLLSQVDEAGLELKQKEQDLTDAKQRAKEIADEVQAKEPGLKEEVARLNGEIKEIEAVIPAGEPRTTYRRLRESQGASAMSRVEDSFCTECNTGATQQDVVRINLGEFVLCRACGRILYNPAD